MISLKHQKAIAILVIIIAVLSLTMCAIGIFSNQITGLREIKTLYGETVKLYGRGIYHNDSVSGAAQAISQDVVTAILGVPLLMISMIFAIKGSLKGRMLLCGTLGYFLYTYISYSFLLNFNPFFLVYVIIMSTSLFAFITVMMSFDYNNLNGYFSKKFPSRLIGIFLIFLAVSIVLMWLGRIVPAMIGAIAPAGLEHYTTLVIQVMDIGIVAPTAILTGILVLKKHPFGFLLATIVILKAITMLTAITAMIIGQAVAGVKMSDLEIVLFPIFNLCIFYLLFVVMKNIKQTA